MTEARRLATARVPYVHAGRSEVTGVDCVGMLTIIARRLEYPFRDVDLNYSVNADGTMVDRLLEHLDLVPSGETAEPGDVGVFYTNPRSRAPQHVGVFVDGRGCDLGMVHVDMRVGFVVEISNASQWIRRTVGNFRLRGYSPWRR